MTKISILSTTGLLRSYVLRAYCVHERAGHRRQWPGRPALLLSSLGSGGGGDGAGGWQWAERGALAWHRRRGREAGPAASEADGRGEAGCRREESGETVPDSWPPREVVRRRGRWGRARILDTGLQGARSSLLWAPGRGQGRFLPALLTPAVRLSELRLQKLVPQSPTAVARVTTLYSSKTNQGLRFGRLPQTTSFLTLCGDQLDGSHTSNFWVWKT